MVASYPALTGRLPEHDGRLLLDGIFFPGLGEAIRGKSQGDAISCQLPVPSHVMGGTLNKDSYQIDVVLTEAERTIPAQLEDVVNLYGSPSVEILRKQIRASMENRFLLRTSQVHDRGPFRSINERPRLHPAAARLAERSARTG